MDMSSKTENVSGVIHKLREIFFDNFGSPPQLLRNLLKEGGGGGGKVNSVEKKHVFKNFFWRYR